MDFFKKIGRFIISIPLVIPKIPRALWNFTYFMGKEIWYLINFCILLTVYLSSKLFIRLNNSRFCPSFLKKIFSPVLTTIYRKVVNFNRSQDLSINKINLIELAIRNMTFKKSRTLITIGGMAVGIASIVFLVSIGYGLQELVISRVARLEELRQIDVLKQQGSQVKFDDKTIASLKSLPDVELVLPVIGVVGKVNIQNSITDMPVYGVTSDYLKQSALILVSGKLFESNDLVTKIPQEPGEVAGISTTSLNQQPVFNNKIQEIEFAIEPGKWIRVREKPDANSAIIGYTKRPEGKQTGTEVWGNFYEGSEAGKFAQDDQGKWFGKWISASVQIWKNQKCEAENKDCVDGNYLLVRDQDGNQEQKPGFFAQLNISVTGINIRQPDVLGISESSESARVTNGIQDLGSGFVEIASESAAATTVQTKSVALSNSAKKQAVVNMAMIKVLGLNESDVIGKTFDVSFIVTGDLLTNESEKIESITEEYTIVGLLPDDQTPLFYVPFIDLRSLGITNFSQAKVVVKDKNDLAFVRQQIEAMGFETHSVADTVAQIDSLFSTARTVLAVIGMVALIVAALGMFNTLTVSLLERTREVGLMKAMGMRSSEVRELFLTESMTMGVFGGVLGIFMGMLFGELVGVLISSFSIFKGVGFIDVSYTPIIFILAAFLLSLVVGVLTGIYPARRATKISALNALRYE